VNRVPAARRAALLAVARGERPADLLLRGGRVVNVLSAEVHRADVAIAEGLIAGVGSGWAGRREVDVGGALLAPGFIEGHIHVEGSLLAPFELARVVSARGTGTLLADPHEIGNVLGAVGVEWMLAASEGAPAEVLLMAPSCVPASPLGTAGAAIGPAEVERLLGHERVIGLAEAMDYPGVIAGAEGPLAKIAAADGTPIDGHAPGVSGTDLAAYVLAGPGSEHEATTPEEALEKLRSGMRVMLREGTPARDMDALLPILNPLNSRRCMLVNDDVSISDLLERGHLDHHLRRAVAAGLDPLVAVQMVTINVPEWFGLADRGAIAPGRLADLVVLEDLEGFEARAVYHRGELVAEDGRSTVPHRPPSDTGASVRVDPERIDLRLEAAPGARARVIEAMEGSIRTGSSLVEAPLADGAVRADPAEGLAKLAVIERHSGASATSVALVRGLGLARGALASTVAHDHHNLIVAGISDEDILAACRALVDSDGGFAVAAGGQVQAVVPLPLAGLMSERPAEEVAARHREAVAAAQWLGSGHPDPLMTLSFLGLEVIPELKLTDRGLVDVEAFRLVEPIVAE
jgi:adenine deaminase